MTTRQGWQTERFSHIHHLCCLFYLRPGCKTTRKWNSSSKLVMRLKPDLTFKTKLHLTSLLLWSSWHSLATVLMSSRANSKPGSISWKWQHCLARIPVPEQAVFTQSAAAEAFWAVSVTMFPICVEVSFSPYLFPAGTRRSWMSRRSASQTTVGHIS